MTGFSLPDDVELKDLDKLIRRYKTDLALSRKYAEDNPYRDVNSSVATKNERKEATLHFLEAYVNLVVMLKEWQKTHPFNEFESHFV